MELQAWNAHIHNLDQVLEGLYQRSIVFVGRTPYPKIVPALLLPKGNYVIYSLRDSKEIKYLREYCPVFSFEEKFPKELEQINSVTKLIRSRRFRVNFLESLKRKGRYALMFNLITEHLHEWSLNKQIHLLGNYSNRSVFIGDKVQFRAALKSLSLPCPLDLVIDKDQFCEKDFDELRAYFGGDFVCQRGEDNYAIEGIATVIIRSKKDFQRAVKQMANPQADTKKVLLTKFIVGPSLSMLGCVVNSSQVLTSALQTQLIDVAELLEGATPSGLFMGHDWGLRNWDENIESEARRIVERIGKHLNGTQGYSGIFGIDFIYDEQMDRILPTECNPRFTGALPFAMLLSLEKGLPPFELFHITSLLGIPIEFDFDGLKHLYRQQVSGSHIHIPFKGGDTMSSNIDLGIYAMAEGTIKFVRHGLFPWDIKDGSEFLLVDAVLRKGQPILPGDRAFQLFFPCSTAQSSFALQPKYRKVVQYFSDRLAMGPTPCRPGP
jgi:ATP-grasp domain-containing protein